MRRSLVLLLTGLLLTPPLYAQARHHGSHRSSGHGIPCGKGYIAPGKTCHVDGAPAPRASSPGHEGGVARDKHGRIKRNESAKWEFEKQTGHAGGWKGHVVDHVVPLACGGADDPQNMQWQTTAEAKAKDRVERNGCERP